MVFLVSAGAIVPHSVDAGRKLGRDRGGDVAVRGNSNLQPATPAPFCTGPKEFDLKKYDDDGRFGFGEGNAFD